MQYNTYKKTTNIPKTFCLKFLCNILTGFDRLSNLVYLRSLLIRDLSSHTYVYNAWTYCELVTH